jgi:hypothetical protein
MTHRRAIRLSIRPSKLFAIALLMLLPLLLLGGSVAHSAQAGATPQVPGTGNHAQRPEILVLRVYFNSTAERDILATELGPEETDTRVGYLTVFGDQMMYDSLRARGIRVEIDEAQTKAANNPILFGNTFYGGYFTVEEMEAFLDQKVATYPNLAEKVDAGDSWCKTHPGQCVQPQPYNGYDIWAMRITNRTIPGPKPVFWFGAGIHSREIATSEVAMRYISWLLDNYNTNADARWLVDHHDIWVMPMTNPDGHHIVEAGGNSPYTHRKNADRDDGCTQWPPTNSSQFGVDLNRNFPFLWNCCGGSSGSPCSLTYRGPAASSEEETQAVTAQVRALIPDQRGPNNNDPAPLLTTGIYLDMHSTGNLNLYPWGWGTKLAPNSADLRNITAHMTAPNAGGNGYTYCQPSICLYVTDGASDDWAYGELGAPAFTIELSGGSFFPPYTQVENIWTENRGTLIYMAKIARTPYLLTRGPDANMVATNPMTVTQGMQSQLTGTINYAWTGNSYNQNVAAAEYYIDTPPWAGGTAVPMAAATASSIRRRKASRLLSTRPAYPQADTRLCARQRRERLRGQPELGPMTATWLVVTPQGGTPTPTPLATSTATQTSTANPTPQCQPAAAGYRWDAGLLQRQLRHGQLQLRCPGRDREPVFYTCYRAGQGHSTGLPGLHQLEHLGRKLHANGRSAARTTSLRRARVFVDQSIPSQYQYYRFIGLSTSKTSAASTSPARILSRYVTVRNTHSDSCNTYHAHPHHAR